MAVQQGVLTGYADEWMAFEDQMCEGEVYVARTSGAAAASPDLCYQLMLTTVGDASVNTDIVVLTRDRPTACYAVMAGNDCTSRLAASGFAVYLKSASRALPGPPAPLTRSLVVANSSRAVGTGGQGEDQLRACPANG
eukprot:8826459-Pyramimonas_sp.AAC.1